MPIKKRVYRLTDDAKNTIENDGHLGLKIKLILNLKTLRSIENLLKRDSQSLLHFQIISELSRKMNVPPDEVFTMEEVE